MSYQSITIKVGDRKASVHRGGSGSMTILLIPGGPGFSALTMLPEASMVAGYASWLAIDPPGSGMSTAPDDPAGYGIDEHAEWYRAVCVEIGMSEVHVLGASFGGMVALALADIAPNLVKSLVCISTRVKGADIDPNDDESDAVEAALARHSNAPWYQRSRDIFDRWTDLVFDATTDEEVTKLNSAIMPLYLANPDAPDVQERLASLGSFTLSLKAMVAWESGVYQSMDIRSHLLNVKQPLLFVCGESDWMAGPVFTKAAAELNPNAMVQVIQNSGHMPSIENPDQLGRVLVEWYHQFL